MTKLRVRIEGGDSGWLSDEDSRAPIVYINPGANPPRLLDPKGERKVIVPKDGLSSEEKYLVSTAILESGYKFKYD